MADISLPWGGDFSLDATGDIASVEGDAELIQRIVRRFLTNTATQVLANGQLAGPPDYIWDPEYGGNARLYVDATVNATFASMLQKSLLQQMLQEAEIVPSPPPSIIVTRIPNGVALTAQAQRVSGSILSLPQIEVVN